MKMTAVDEMINGGTTHHGPSPSAIGTEFARQYYTLLAENPTCVHKFYSHESVLLLNNTSTVTGQQSIGRAIEDLAGEVCRIKIVSINGVSTFHNGIALQVFGEMSGRRFVQTFILGPQGAKKYYVQNDIFQFLDFAFNKASSTSDTPEPMVEKVSAPMTLSSQTVSNTNGHAHQHHELDLLPSVETPILSSPELDRLVPVVPDPVATLTPIPTAPTANDERPRKRPSPKKDDTPKRKEKQEPKTETQHDAIVPAPVVDNTPKTWAKLVGGGSSKPVQPPAAITKPAPSPQKSTSQQKPQQNGTAVTAAVMNNVARNQVIGERRIYVGGITRKILPENTTAAEQEIRESFIKYGEVENVAMPRKVLDQPSDQSRAAFAFVTMKTVSDAQNVFKMARKDDRGYQVSAKIPSFGFDGDVFVSEQKDRPTERSGFRGGRGGSGNFSGRGGSGGFAPRGRGGRGGFRGGQHNQSAQH